MRTLLAAVMLTGLPLVASAQRPDGPIPEARAFAGVFVPTGDHRDLLNDAPFTGAQLALEVRPGITTVASFGWAPTEDRTRTSLADVDIYQYDLGLELARTRQLGTDRQFKPFLGIGVGGRTYAYRDLDVDSQTNVVGHAALGGELRMGRLSFRLEGRDYVSGFEGLDGTAGSSTRNDLSVTAGIAYRFR